MLNRPGLTAHHIGCLTDNMDRSLGVYRQMGFLNISEIYTIGAQNVRVCFIEISKDFYLELVEFSETSASLKKIFKSGNPYYHVGYFVESVDKTIEQLTAEGFMFVNRFLSEAFKNKPCAFLYTPEMHLIELMEL